MVKDGEDKHGLQTTNLNNLGNVSALNLNRCVPRYWTNKELDKLREAKKVELNDWNKEVLAVITEGMPDVFSKGRTQDGLTCIIIEKVGTRRIYVDGRRIMNTFFGD